MTCPTSFARTTFSSTFTRKDDSGSCVDDYNTNIIGRFTCHNPVCQARGWSSKQIAITIRRYSNQRFNARVYHQSCKSCETPSKPILDLYGSQSFSSKSFIWSSAGDDRFRKECFVVSVARDSTWQL